MLLRLIQSRQLKPRFNVLCAVAGVALMQQQVEEKTEPISKETPKSLLEAARPGASLRQRLRWEAVSIHLASHLSLPVALPALAPSPHIFL